MKKKEKTGKIIKKLDSNQDVLVNEAYLTDTIQVQSTKAIF